MNIRIPKKKSFVCILTIVLIAAFGVQGMSYAQEATPTITASVDAPLTEVNLSGSVVTLTLSGATYAGFWDIGDAMSVSGIEGVLSIDAFFDVDRVSDTEVTVELTFSGNIDADTPLVFTVGSAAIAGYDGPALTAQVPVTATDISNATVSISPASTVSPNIGEPLTLSLNITGGENVAGYQATVSFDYSGLDYTDSANGDYLPADAFFWDSGEWSSVTFAASTLAGPGNGDGTLTTLTFEVVDFKASTVTLSEVYLVDTDGKRWETRIENGEITIPPEPADAMPEDLNRDGVVNIQDLVIVSVHFGQSGKNNADVNGDGLVNIVDLTLVAGAFNEAAAAPLLNRHTWELLTAGDVQGWLVQARQLTRTDPAYLHGITVLEQLLKALTPKQTTLLPNYPNPFNPETWIPYHLSNDVTVHISIYDTKGVLVRRLDVGHQIAGSYTDRTKAAYWDGRNAFGEPVASGMYFYHLSAGTYSATRKMLIRK